MTPNEITAAYPDRQLNADEAEYKAALAQAKRDLDVAEARALSLSGSLGSNKEERDRNAILYLAGQTGMSPAQEEAVAEFARAQRRVDETAYALLHIEREQKNRRHERTDALIAANRALADVGLPIRLAA
jgi:hypothetical protein